MGRNVQAYNEYMNDYMKRRYKRRREEAIDRLGKTCAECGTTEDLEFDHIEPHLKEVTIARASSFSEKRWQEELSKCQLLCHDCHVTKHASEAQCGSVQKYWRGCHCLDCTAANTAHNREYRLQRSLTAETL